MKDKIRDIITDALEKANVKFDTDGENIWVDDPYGVERSNSIGFIDCDPEESDSEKHLYSVSLHATFAGSFDVKASSGSEAEELVRDRFQNENIKVSDLELDTTEEHATEVI